MNKKRFKSIFATAALCLFLGACAAPIPKGSPSFALVSNQEERMKEFYEPMGQPIKEKDCSFSIFEGFVSWGGSRKPNEEAVLVRVLEKYNADALMNTEFKNSFIYVPIFYHHFCTSVTGTPVKLKG